MSDSGLVAVYSDSVLLNGGFIWSGAPFDKSLAVCRRSRDDAYWQKAKSRALNIMFHFTTVDFGETRHHECLLYLMVADAHLLVSRRAFDL